MKILWIPGTLILWIMWVFPIETGSKRNVVSNTRMWNNRHIFAPLISILIYVILAGLFLK